MQRALGLLKFLIRKGTWSILEQGLFTGSNALLNIVLARALGPNDFGAYWLAFSIYLLAFPIHGALVVEPMLVFGSGRFRATWPRYFSLLLWGHTLFAAVWTLLLIIGSAVVHLLSPGTFANALMSLSIASPFLLLQVMLRRASYVIRQPQLAAMAGALYGLLLLGGAFTLKSLQLLTATTSLLLMGLSALLSVTWLIPRLGSVDARPAVDAYVREVVARHLDYGRWSVGYRLLRWVPYNLAYFLLPVFGNLGATGTLRAMQVLFMPISQAVSATSALVLPGLVAARETGNFMSRVWGLLGIIVTASILYVLLIGLGGDSWLSLFYGDEYVGNGWLLWVLGLGVVMSVGREMLESAMKALERPDLVFTTGLVTTVVFVVVGTVLVATLGIVGAAYSLLIPPTLLGLLLVRKLVKTTSGVRQNSVLPAASTAPNTAIRDVNDV